LPPPDDFPGSDKALEINLSFIRGLNPGVEKRSGTQERLAMQALAIAAAGMSAAANRLGASAERVATWEARETDTDLAREAVEQISAKNDFKANAAVIKTADEMIGALLDLKV
jgi:flagellar basal body rod protein FlgC